MQDAADLARQRVNCPHCGGQFVVGSAPTAQFDPYYTWLGIPPSERPANHYRLLGLQLFESNPGVIENAADRQMKHLHSFKIGAKAALSQRLLTEVAAARVELLDPARKAAYDQELRSRTTEPALPDLPSAFNAGPLFTTTVGSVGGTMLADRRRGRRGNATALLSNIGIVLGGIAGLAIGALIIFYLTGQSLFSLSGNGQQPSHQADATTVPPTAQPQPKTARPQPKRTAPDSPQPAPLELPPSQTPKNPGSEQPQRSFNPQTSPSVPAPDVAGPPRAEGAKRSPLADAPTVFSLPEQGPTLLVQLAAEPDEPVQISIHSSAADLPAKKGAIIAAEDRMGRGWTIQYANKAAGVPNEDLAVIRRDGLQLIFDWVPLPADAALRRKIVDLRHQLSNCLLAISASSSETKRFIQLRDIKLASPLVLDVEGGNPSIDLKVGFPPRTEALALQIREIAGFPRDAKLIGGEKSISSRNSRIEFAEMKGAQISLSVSVRDDSKAKAKTVVLTAAPQFQDSDPISGVHWIPMTLSSLEHFEQIANSQLNQFKELRSKGQVKNLDERIHSLEARLTAVPKMRSFIQSLKAGTIQLIVTASCDDEKITLVETQASLPPNSGP
jgi:hypothetical protein